MHRTLDDPDGDGRHRGSGLGDSVRHTRRGTVGFTTLEWALAAVTLVAVLAMVAEGVVYVRADSAGQPASARELPASAPATPSARSSQMSGGGAKAADTAAKSDVATIGKEIATYYVDSTVPLRSRDVTLAGGFFHVAGLQVGRPSSVTRSITYVPGPKAAGDPLTTWCVQLAYVGGTRPVVSYSAQEGLVASACADQSAAVAAQQTAQPSSSAPPVAADTPRAIDDAARSDVHTLGLEVATYYVDAQMPLNSYGVSVVAGRYLVNGADIALPLHAGPYKPTILFLPGGKSVAQQAAHWCVQLTYTGGTRTVVSYSARQGLLQGACPPAS